MEERTGGGLLLPLALTGFGFYFVFAAVQGDGGVFRRIELEAERETLRADLDVLEARVAAAEGKVRRLSDDYVDLDLLDERARVVLGMARADELILE